MKTYQSGGGYYFKEYKNGKKVRISKEQFLKSNKSQKGGANRYYHFFTKIKNNYYIFLIPSDEMKKYEKLYEHIKYNGECDSILFDTKMTKTGTIKERINKLERKFKGIILGKIDININKNTISEKFPIEENKIVSLKDKFINIVKKTRLFKILNPVVKTPLQRSNSVNRPPLQRSNSFVETPLQRSNSVNASAITPRNTGPTALQYNTEEISHKEAEEAFNFICNNIRFNSITKKKDTLYKKYLLVEKYIGHDTMKNHIALLNPETLNQNLSMKAPYSATNKDKVNINPLLSSWCDNVRPLLDSKLTSKSIKMPNNKLLQDMKRRNMNEYYKDLYSTESNRINSTRRNVIRQRGIIQQKTGISINPITGKKTKKNQYPLINYQYHYIY